ncbi:hypothetical protein DLM75_23145 [Leptospira stimsonii]|uniref:Uncharacterized protein n=1 Tax=Leptospira stimsonii TaxID=2202203 RepID=A0A396YQF0_9LEPT|nr:hypothetical protein DLM75_23145 [Leptospira stimsonii]
MNGKLTEIRNYWNAKIIFFISSIFVLLVIGLSFYLGNKPLINHLKEICITISTIFFLFIYYGLYHGYKWLEESIDVKYKLIDLDMSGINISNIEIPDLDLGPLSIIFSIVAWLFFSAFIIIASLYFISFVWVTLIFLTSMLNWIFYRGLRTVFLNSKQCHGNHLKSSLTSVKFTLGYIGWVSILIYFYDNLK